MLYLLACIALVLISAAALPAAMRGARDSGLLTLIGRALRFTGRTARVAIVLVAVLVVIGGGIGLAALAFDAIDHNGARILSATKWSRDSVLGASGAAGAGIVFLVALLHVFRERRATSKSQASRP